MAVSFSQSKWSKREQAGNHESFYDLNCTLLVTLYSVSWKWVTKFSKEKRIRPHFLMEECERNCGHLKTTIVPKGLLCAWHYRWYKRSKAQINVCLSEVYICLGKQNVLQDFPWMDSKGELLRAGDTWARPSEMLFFPWFLTLIISAVLQWSWILMGAFWAFSPRWALWQAGLPHSTSPFVNNVPWNHAVGRPQSQMLHLCYLICRFELSYRVPIIISILQITEVEFREIK